MKDFGDGDFMNNILYKEKGRVAALEAKYIERKANGYYVTRSGRDFINRMKGVR